MASHFDPDGCLGGPTDGLLRALDDLKAASMAAASDDIDDCFRRAFGVTEHRPRTVFMQGLWTLECPPCDWRGPALPDRRTALATFQAHRSGQGSAGP